MKLLQKLITVGLVTAPVSCSVHDDGCGSRCQAYADAWRTPAQGRAMAREDISREGYKIYRYDMPPVRAGSWAQYDARYKHFGIKELWGSANGPPSLEYMKAYNKQMDASLIDRYGAEYLKYRARLIPAADALPWESKQDGGPPRQP